MANPTKGNETKTRKPRAPFNATKGIKLAMKLGEGAEARAAEANATKPGSGDGWAAVAKAARGLIGALAQV